MGTRRSLRLVQALVLMGASLMPALAAAPPAHAATASTISAGFGHTCLIASTNGALKCWGRNDRGELGDGTTTARSTPVGVVGMQSKIASVSAGVDATCAVSTAGALKCWGAASLVGNGTTTDALAPASVTGLTSGVAAVSVGADHVCALTRAGGVKCWGSGSRGQLGDGLGVASSTPVDVSGLTSGVVAVASGNLHSCALTSAGEVWCWGYNVYGQVGDGSTVDALTPTRVVGLSGIKAIATGGYHSCAITAASAGTCWGQNTYGELGDGTTTDSPAPVDVVGLSGVASITAGFYHSCATTVGGAASCWGANNTAALGDGTTTNQAVPTPVAGSATGVVGIDGGRGHTCAVTNKGKALCWGWNFYGQIGNGTVSTTPTLTPVPVSGYAK
jgi:alpha-tubulin suppressor-like RCC1 family protein